VFAFLLARWIAARWSLARQLRVAQPSALAAMVDARVAEHATLGPLVAGILRPRIVLPAAFVRSADGETLSFVLAHEAAHLARRDHWLVAAVQVCNIVAWPVLPLWLAARQIRALCELACDERVLAGRSLAQRRRYGEALLRLSGDDFALMPSPLVPSFAWDLRRRLRALKGQRRWHRGGQWALVAGCAGVLLACSGAPEAPTPAPTAGVPDAEAASPPLTSPVSKPRLGPMPAVLLDAPSLTIATNGNLQLNGQVVDRTTFESTLHGLLTTSGTHALRVYGVSGLGPRFTSDLMAAAHRAGAEQIYFVPAAAASGKRGSLDKEIIRTVIKAHINEVKTCYEFGLARRPEIAGRLEAVFTIGDTGKVVSASVENSTLGDPDVAACIAKEVGRWVFPAPTGEGIVVVRYPFTFQPHHDAQVRSTGP
jgi:hypothetical protein